MAEPLTQRARTETATSGAAAAQGQLPNQLPPELKEHLYSLLRPEDRQALSRASKTTQDAVGRTKEREVLQALANRLKESPKGILPALLDRLKTTTYPNRRMVGVGLGVNAWENRNPSPATKRALKDAIEFHIAELAPNEGAKDTVLAQLLLNVMDAVMCPVSQLNAPDVDDYAHDQVYLQREVLLDNAQNGYERFNFGEIYAHIYFSVSADGFKRSITINERWWPGTVTFDGDHPKMFQPRVGGWGLAHRLKELTECTNWRRTGTGNDDAYVNLIASLILESGMFHSRNRELFISAGFADACAAGY